MAYVCKYYTKLWPKTIKNITYMKSYFFLGFCVFFGWYTLTGQQEIIVDTHTGHKVDDSFDLLWILFDPSAKAMALNTFHWQSSQWTLTQGFEENHRFNQQSVKTLGRGIPHRYNWENCAHHSAGSYGLIQQARQLSQDEKLPVFVLGAFTNVALAMEMYRQEILKKIGDHPLNQFLMNHWYQPVYVGRNKRMLWELALTTAFLHQKMAPTKTLKSSKDNGNREITFYYGLDTHVIYSDYYASMNPFESTKP